MKFAVNAAVQLYSGITDDEFSMSHACWCKAGHCLVLWRAAVVGARSLTAGFWLRQFDRE